VKNQKLFGSHNYENVVAHVASGVAREKKTKVVQFGIVLHLLL